MGKGLQLLNLFIAEEQRRHRTSKRLRAPRMTLTILPDISGTGHYEKLRYLRPIRSGRWASSLATFS